MITTNRNWKKIIADNFASKKTFKKLELYVDLLLEKNNEMNLTGFDEETIWRDGIYQSIVLLKEFIKYRSNKFFKVLDIGAGAGFPSLPLFIIANEKFHLTIYEPIKKRVDFLNLVKEKLELQNIVIVNQRIEDSNEDESFDYVCARAVMRLNMLIEVSARCGKIGCKYVFLKSKGLDKEIEESKWILSKVMKIPYETHIHNMNIGDGRKHKVFIYRKDKKTPTGIPRKWSDIKNKKIIKI